MAKHLFPFLYLSHNHILRKLLRLDFNTCSALDNHKSFRQMMEHQQFLHLNIYILIKFYVSPLIFWKKAATKFY